MHTKYIKLYTTHTYELPEFSSKIGFQVVEMGCNLELFVKQPYLTTAYFEAQNDSTTLFNQRFLHFDHKNL